MAGICPIEAIMSAVLSVDQAQSSCHCSRQIGHDTDAADNPVKHPKTKTDPSYQKLIYRPLGSFYRRLHIGGSLGVRVGNGNSPDRLSSKLIRSFPLWPIGVVQVHIFVGITVRHRLTVIASTSRPASNPADPNMPAS